MFKATKNGFKAVFFGSDPMKEGEGKRKTANRITRKAPHASQPLKRVARATRFTPNVKAPILRLQS